MLFYSTGGKEIGITPLMHKPLTSEDGYVLLLVSPQLESVRKETIPRDMVLVLDVSGSMDAVKMDQARKALKYCLNNLNPQDRFGVISFATSVRAIAITWSTPAATSWKTPANGSTAWRGRRHCHAGGD